jgi:divalent metal cation (Fe/Co/Zn/Cd) transporter
MPLLARATRRVGHQLGSAATVSEGTQNLLCAYLSVALLAGLGANALTFAPTGNSSPQMLGGSLT